VIEVMEWESRDMEGSEEGGEKNKVTIHKK
jgi:hypothetical protein